jgi:hypothetical protein
LAVAGVIAAAAVRVAGAQETVTISIPPTVSFHVTDIGRTTTGTPAVSTIGFSNAALGAKVLRVSVQPDAVAFTPPAGPAIPASLVSWHNLGASGGIGADGMLSSLSYVLMFQSDPGRTSGHLEVEWRLAPPSVGIRAGSHQLTLRWKVESITP